VLPESRCDCAPVELLRAEAAAAAAIAYRMSGTGKLPSMGQLGALLVLLGLRAQPQ